MRGGQCILQLESREGFSVPFDLVEKCRCGKDANVFEADRAECVDCYLRRVKN